MKDLFEHYQEQPQELKNVLNQWEDRINNGLDHNQYAQLLREVEAVGFTFEYELSAEPFNLRKLSNIEILEKQLDHFMSKIKLKDQYLRNCRNAINSGAIDTDLINVNDFTIARVIFTIVLEQLTNQHKPIGVIGKQEYNNIKHFI